MKIMYIKTSPTDNTAEWMKRFFPAHDIFSFNIPDNPEEAIDCIQTKCDAEGINMVMGTGIGGFYAMTIKGVQKIVINPIKNSEAIFNRHFEIIDEEDIGETYAIFGEDTDCEFVETFKKFYRKKQIITAKFGCEMTEEVFTKEFTELFDKAEKDFNTRTWLV